MAFKKGDPKPPTSGKKKGQCNGDTAKLRELILGALDDCGGQAYLKQQAIENPSAFMSLIGKVLPKDVNASITGANGGPIRTINIIELVPFAKDTDTAP
ncbi:MAG: hypothetical protein ACXWT5_13365 [Methylophilus sp.]